MLLSGQAGTVANVGECIVSWLTSGMRGWLRDLPHGPSVFSLPSPLPVVTMMPKRRRPFCWKAMLILVRQNGNRIRQNSVQLLSNRRIEITQLARRYRAGAGWG